MKFCWMGLKFPKICFPQERVKESQYQMAPWHAESSNNAGFPSQSPYHPTGTQVAVPVCYACFSFWFTSVFISNMYSNLFFFIRTRIAWKLCHNHIQTLSSRCLPLIFIQDMSGKQLGTKTSNLVQVVFLQKIWTRTLWKQTLSPLEG